MMPGRWCPIPMKKSVPVRSVQRTTNNGMKNHRVFAVHFCWTWNCHRRMDGWMDGWMNPTITVTTMKTSWVTTVFLSTTDTTTDTTSDTVCCFHVWINCNYNDSTALYYNCFGTTTTSSTTQSQWWRNDRTTMSCLVFFVCAWNEMKWNEMKWNLSQKRVTDDDDDTHKLRIQIDHPSSKGMVDLWGRGDESRPIDDPYPVHYCTVLYCTVLLLQYVPLVVQERVCVWTIFGHHSWCSCTVALETTATLYNII